ncbi:MAG: L,D-transpeptidase [Bifidobacterium longum]|nr:L,D-transpeptidase [Bifidobacterium longum]
MTERRRARMRIRRQRIYVVRRIVVAVCALLCCVLAVFSTIDVQRVWPRGESVAQGQAEVQGQAQKMSQSAQQSASRVSASASSLDRQQVPVFNQAIQEQRDKEAQRARWTNPTGKQPDLSQYSDLSVKVSIAKQEVYVQSGGETIYTMIASTGLNDTTPRGNYVIGMRGDHFYNPAEGMGADYWVRFNGPFLFHSVPTGANSGEYMEEEGNKLGQPASHGCVRLTVADAEWFYNQIPEGTPVTIA